MALGTWVAIILDPEWGAPNATVCGGGGGHSNVPANAAGGCSVYGGGGGGCGGAGGLGGVGAIYIFTS